MIDKIQKIRNEVERLQNELIQEREKGYCSDADDACILELQNVLTYIDSLQEEPAPKIFEDMLNAKTPAESLGISAEEHEKIIDRCLYGKEPEMVDIDDLPKEEPVSEDLEEVAEAYALDDYIKPWRELVKRAFKAGAKWQKQQDQSTIELAEDHAMLAGMEKMKEEMMAKAIDGDVTFDYYGVDDKTYGCIAHDSFCLEDFGLKDRDKVKVIVINEK